jgi:hypothetical protein
MLAHTTALHELYSRDQAAVWHWLLGAYVCPNMQHCQLRQGPCGLGERCAKRVVHPSWPQDTHKTVRFKSKGALNIVPGLKGNGLNLRCLAHAYTMLT